MTTDRASLTFVLTEDGCLDVFETREDAGRGMEAPFVREGGVYEGAWDGTGRRLAIRICERRGIEHVELHDDPALAHEPDLLARQIRQDFALIAPGVDLAEGIDGITSSLEAASLEELVLARIEWERAGHRRPGPIRRFVRRLRATLDRAARA